MTKILLVFYNFYLKFRSEKFNLIHIYPYPITFFKKIDGQIETITKIMNQDNNRNNSLFLTKAIAYVMNSCSNSNFITKRQAAVVLKHLAEEFRDE